MSPVDPASQGLSWQLRNATHIDKKLTPTHRDITVRASPSVGIGLRLDKFLHLALPTLSRSLIKGWLDRGFGTMNGKPAKAGHKVTAEALIHLHCPLPPNPTDRDFEPDELTILYEDEGIVIVNKPPGQLAHQAGRVLTGTVLNQLQDLLVERGQDPLQARLVNRIDRDTSGILVATLDAEHNRRMSTALQAGRFHKEYRAICTAVPDPAHGHWRQAIRDDPTGRSIARQLHPEGQDSHTEYEILERAGDAFALLRVILHTGRQHQIRVHASGNGHPLVGDWTYGPACEELGGQALHAAVLTFPHPLSGSDVTVEAPLPRQLAELWQHLQTQGMVTPRALSHDEERRLGLGAESSGADTIVPGGWRRPSWMSHDEYQDWARRAGEE